jgi:iron complex transport system ATP-binding protein
MNRQSLPRLEARSLSCAYAVNGRKAVLYDVDLTLHPGELVGLIGPNGAGKTTLLRALARLLRPQSGQVLLDGHDIWRLTPRQVAQRIGRVPQSANAAWPYTTEHVVRLGRYPHRGWLSPFNGKDAAAVDKMLTLLGLQSMRHRLLNTLSGGEQQRVLIARALVQEPTVLLLDEPIANLDINHQHQVLAMVQNLVREYNLAALLAIHDLGLAARYCDRLILLNQGRIWAAGSAVEVLQPDHLRTVFGVESQLYRDPVGQWALSVQPVGAGVQSLH